ncbi:DivIVA domain-containing protein [candidate division WOR-3 bacterium]|nr:DivIVA domain-containing protein [candidate division WOR-3 bacterium]
MEVTPLDIRKQEFKKSFSGYDKREVENFLEMVAMQLEGLIRENMSYKEQLNDVERKIDDYRRMERTLQDTLTSAQKTTDELRKNAEREGSIILKNSSLESQSIIQQAKIEESQLRSEIKTLITMKNNFIAKFKGMIEAYSKMLGEEILEHKIDVNDINKILKEHPETVSNIGSLFNKDKKAEEPLKENHDQENKRLGGVFKD